MDNSELNFISKEDILMLCEESKKETPTGKLAVISLLSILGYLEDKINFYFEKLKSSKIEITKWQGLLIASIILCIVFMPRIPVYHILFWGHLLFPILSFLGLRYYKVSCYFYNKIYSDYIEYVKLISDSIGVPEDKTNEIS